MIDSDECTCNKNSIVGYKNVTNFNSFSLLNKDSKFERWLLGDAINEFKYIEKA